MSVCMSAVSAGISEVLIKYTGNVWLHTFFIEKMRQFPFEPYINVNGKERKERRK